MKEVELYPEGSGSAPILEGEAWSVLKPRTPVMRPSGAWGVLKEKGVSGDGCTMCSRHKKRHGHEIAKPFMQKGDPAYGSVLCIFSFLNFTDSSHFAVQLLRDSGFKGHIVCDLPVRCGSGDITETQINNCRPYLKSTVFKMRPSRIFCFGGNASKAVLGVAMPSTFNRWCWTTIGTEWGEIPVIGLMDPVKATHSPIHRSILSNELKWGWSTDFKPFARTGRALVPDPVDIKGSLAAIYDWIDRVYEASPRGGELPWVAYDVETDGVMWTEGFSIIACSLASIYLDDVLVWDKAALEVPEFLQALIEILTDPLIGKRGSNEKYDALSWLSWKKVHVDPVTGDGRLEMKLNNADSSATLEAMGFYVGSNAHKSEAKALLKAAKKLAAEDMEDDVEGVNVMAHTYKYLPPEVLIRYNGLDTRVTAHVCDYARKRMGPLETTLKRLTLPAAEVLKGIEAKGMLLDRDAIATSGAFLRGEIEELNKVFAKNGIDPDKPESIRAWLDSIGVKSPYETETGLASTSARALKLIEGENELIARILVHRKLSKLLHSYAETLPGYIRDDGRVHPTALLDGARSGRLAFRNPAVQTIPSRGKLAKLIKSCFVSRPGYTLVALDFSILEIRIAAYLSQDPDMLRAAQTDYHTETAKRIARIAWGMSPEEVEAEILSGVKDKRDICKVINFSIIYGAGPISIAEKVGCSPKEVMKLIAAIVPNDSRLRAWMREQEAFAQRHGYVEIPWLDGTVGRVRPLLDVRSSDRETRGNALRAAVNTPVQSLASDICLSSAVKIDQWYRKNHLPADIVCLVHDSIISEVRDDMVDEVAKMKAHLMCDWPTSGVPLKVEAEKGKAWGAMEKIAL